MTNRRKFILQGSFAATALMLTKPFNAIAGMNATFSNSSNFSQITFLHTTHGSGKQINKLMGYSPNNVLLYTGTKQPATSSSIPFDVSAAALKENWSNSYTIINKNGVKTGVIAIPEYETAVFNRANEIAAHLKKEKDCKLVILMSSLGYKNKNKVDDLHLAASSEHIDIIISQFNKDLPSQTYIAYNKNKDEVIIQHQHEKDASAGKIQIRFNQQGERSGVAFQ